METDLWVQDDPPPSEISVSPSYTFPNLNPGPMLNRIVQPLYLIEYLIQTPVLPFIFSQKKTHLILRN